MELKNRTFAFCRADNQVMIRNIILLENHYVGGRTHPNETYWEYKDNELFFKNDQKEVTTTFHTLINLDGKLICLGSYDEKHMWHILVETNINEQINFQTHFNKLERLLGLQSTQVKQSLSDMSLRTKRLEQNNSKKIKVVFLVHNPATWDSLHDVYQDMVNSENFEIIVACIPRRFPGEGGFGHEKETHQFLISKDIPHIRFASVRNDNLNILKYINPNAIFRQAPWDQDIGPEWSVDSLSFTNLFYVPYYGFNILENFLNDARFEDAYSNQPFHKACAQIFCESELTKESMAQRSSRGGDNLVTTGHPKLEKLLKEESNPSWPISSSRDGVTRIIWAPHHSFSDSDWLSFGLFKEVYLDMLEWVKSNPKIEVVLRPHPALFANLVATKRLSKEKVDDFLREWNVLPNTFLMEGGEYGPLMAASDIMLTEGVSFLAEYMIFWQKPLIFLKSKNHAPFNKIGKMIEAASYIAEDIETVKSLVEILSDSKDNDNRYLARKEVFKNLMPFEKGAASKITESVYQFFRK